MIYLAAPYTHPDPAIQQARFEAITAKAASLMRASLVFSPITYGHPFGQLGLMKTDHETWTDFNRYMLNACHSMYLLPLPGWRQSKGVAWELDYCKQFNIPVTMGEL